MGTKVGRLKNYCPAERLFAAFHRETAAFLDSSLENAYGRYSVIGRYPYLRAEENLGRLRVNGREMDGTLLGFLSRYLKENREENETGLPMISGAVGYLSYDYGRSFEQISTRYVKELDMPEGLFTVYDLYVIDDLEKKELYICTGERLHSYEWYESELSELAGMPDRKNAGGTELPDECEKGGKEAGGESFVSSDFTKQEYLEAIHSMIEYIRSGDIYIANMTRQIKVKCDRAPYEVFRYLRRHNPSPFGGYLNEQNFQIISASPERFLRIRAGNVETRPIKGTRKRGKTQEEDRRLRMELEASEKDRSELLMIVDLERNDLNRVCEPGSVQVTELFAVESYATVFHLVSTVTGQLKAGKTAADLIGAAFPGGSITGAPKIRAMEIIDELEHSRRGLYTGSIGYLSMNGDCDLNIVIRTAVHQNGTYHLGAGGGITAESEPEFEYDETWQKARAVVEAITGGDKGWMDH